MKTLRLLLVVLIICLLVAVEAKSRTRSGRRRSRRRSPERRRPTTTTTTTADPEPTTTQKPVVMRHKPQFNMNGPVPDAPLLVRKGERPANRRRTGPEVVPPQGVDTRNLGSNRMSSEKKLILLEAHNDFRGQVSPTAANMVALQWDDELADMAQMWADQCRFMHGGTSGGSGRFGWVGQNLWVGSGTGWELYGMVESWYNEEQYYTYANGNCNSVCGHYTQVVWAETQFVGCALTTCQSIQGLSGWSPASILVCNYGEGGNYVGVKPYISGTPCSQCPTGYTSCIDGELCALPSQVPDNGDADETETETEPTAETPNQPVQGGGPPGPNPEAPGVTSRPNANECGGVLEDASGEITSPSWPAPYGINTHCQWVIRGSSDQTVTLELGYMDIEPEKLCSWDYLQVKPNGATGSSSTKYCGNVNPVAITSQGNEMAVIFHSDNTVNKGGFTASYRLNGGKQEMDQGSACGGTITGKKGTIKSPNYPREYSEDLDCLWIIEVASNKRVRLTFKTFDVEENAMCDFDRVTVRVGNERLPMTFCGNDKPNGNIISLSNHMEIRLVTDEVGNRGGFSATWRAI